MMATSWKSQQGKGKYALQFETDDEGKYKLVEKAAQMAMDGKTIDDLAEVKHGKWLVTDSFDHHKTPIYRCSVCRREVADSYINLHEHCLRCGAKMDGGKEE